VVLEVGISGFYVGEIHTDLGLFTRVEIPGCGETADVGKALLPVLRRAIEIPQGAELEIEVLRLRSTRYLLSDLKTSSRVLPVQEPVVKLPGERESAAFAFSEDFYASDAPYPANEVRISETGQLRAHRFAMIEFSPVCYRPASGIVDVVRSIQVKVTSPGANRARTEEVLTRYASPEFEEAASRRFLNYRPPPVKAAPDCPAAYLIITDAAFYDAIQPLAEWKNRKGYATTVTRTSEIPGGATTTTIKDYIKNAWLNWDVPPTFVLLVGDVSDIPNWTGTTSGNPPTDLYYSTMTDPDYIPDLGIGRFSVTTAAEASQLAHRVIHYEKSLLPTTSWFKRAVFMASEDNYSISEGTHNYVIENYLNPAGFTTDRLYCHTHSATTQQVSDAFNGGRGLGIYSGHGATTSWADGPPFSQSEVNSLTNLDMYPFVQSYACYTGDYTYGECFAETWIRASDKAAIAFWASSVTSYWDEDDILEKGVFRALFDDGLTWISGMTNQGKWYLYEHYSAGGSTRRYYEMYNLMGDPSLDIWTDVPTAAQVTHSGTCPVGAGAYAVHVEDTLGPVADARVCLDLPGDVYETACTESDGRAQLTLDPPPSQVGTMNLTVTRHNLAPACETIEVVVPAVVTVDPDTIQIRTPTAVTVTIQDTVSQPMADVVVTIGGWGVDPPLADTTDALGRAVVTVDAPYGETLRVVGREIGEGFDCFERTVVVTGGLAQSNPRIEARVDALGLEGALTPNFEGTLLGRVDGVGLDLYAVGCGVDTFVSSATDTAVLRVTPAGPGVVTVALSYPGYDLHTEAVPVVDVYGTLSGTVSEASTANPLAGVPVVVYPAGADTVAASPLWDLISAANGAYAAPDSLPAGEYDIYARKFGYLDHAGTARVLCGANVHDIWMVPAPTGVISGTVTEEETGGPITATVRIYRSDDGSLHSETGSDSLSGGTYVTAPLPYFTYLVQVSAPHFMTQNVPITVDESPETLNILMAPTRGNVLVIDDGTGSRSREPKRGHKGVWIVFDGPEIVDVETEKSAAVLAQDLEDLGYDVTIETPAFTEPAAWFDFDAVIWSCGDNANPVSDATWRSSLNAYVAAHGRLLIEGGGVGYDAASYPGYPHFADTTLHVTAWENDSAGHLALSLPAHPIATLPNALPPTLAMTYSAYGDQDALIPDGETRIVYDWSSAGGRGGLLVYDDNPDPGASQVVFYTFDYSNVSDPGVRKDLLENTVVHLLAREPEPGGSTCGSVRLFEQATHDGVVVRTHPMGLSDTTDADGNFEIAGLYGGTYLLTARKSGFADSTVSVEIAGGGAAENVTFTLFPVYEHMEYPEIAIPDNNSGGIRVYLDVAEDLEISSVDCYADITHSYRGDLVVELTSPTGTTVRLHDRTGGSADDITTWFDMETPCDGPGSMGDFAGESSQGRWELMVSDLASYDTGTLHQWGLRIAAPRYAGVEEESAPDAPAMHFLAPGYPNPFNPVTHVRFGLSRACDVDLSIYNIHGRRVRVLASRPYEAGRHTLAWDGTDSRGATVASGVYFCRLCAEGFTATQPMVLMK